ncbi:hypothetical protein [Lewinella sp. W8]|uniref:hypothetical protein n=1 Tax=Lewinella sp. W8 TaxID=2528208 RepID=UPI0010674C28|nr:hypothetical protein [Lewinella sp. W8]MTB52450.1 hypothetical protein [Lewinella sp. W8]
MRFLYCFIPFLLSVVGHAQDDFGWWNEANNWDGATDWREYIIISPGFMGPNALPVPEIFTGQMDSTFVAELGIAGHRSPGDDTDNLFTRLFTPLFSERVGFDLRFVPLERYQMTTATRDERRSRDFDGRGTAVGDVYLATLVQLVEEQKQRPGVLLGVHLRTASGTNLGGARFTDSPGYHFDLSAGKTYRPQGGWIRSVRPYLMAGFLVFQVSNRGNDQRQNDCFLFGGGVDLGFTRVMLRQQIGGYLGYLDNRDKPIVYRLRVESRFGGRLNLAAGLQAGLNDWAYTTGQLSVIYRGR